MSLKSRDSFLRKIYQTSPKVLKAPHLSELVKVYEDLEKTLRHLKKNYGQDAVSAPIDIRKLILQLSRSKKKLERKIGNTLLLEKEHLERRLKSLAAAVTR